MTCETCARHLRPTCDTPTTAAIMESESWPCPSHRRKNALDVSLDLTAIAQRDDGTYVEGGHR